MLFSFECKNVDSKKNGSEESSLVAIAMRNDFCPVFSGPRGTMSQLYRSGLDNICLSVMKVAKTLIKCEGECFIDRICSSTCTPGADGRGLEQ